MQKQGKYIMPVFDFIYSDWFVKMSYSLSLQHTKSKFNMVTMTKLDTNLDILSKWMF